MHHLILVSVFLKLVHLFVALSTVQGPAGEGDGGGEEGNAARGPLTGCLHPGTQDVTLSIPDIDILAGYPV